MYINVEHDSLVFNDKNRIDYFLPATTQHSFINCMSDWGSIEACLAKAGFQTGWMVH
jgi:hypothetical protein